MFSVLFRILGLVVLAFALVLAVLDLTRSISAAAPVVTPLADLWTGVSAASFEQLRETVTNLHPLLWDPTLSFVVGLPGWLVAFVIALLMLWAGQPRDNRFGRFASR